MRPGLAARSQLDLVEHHWRGLAAPGALPRRRDLDASALGGALPQAFTLEEVAPGVARVRVAGQRLHDWFGADPRGVPISAIFDEVGRPALREALTVLFGAPALVEIGVATPGGRLREPVAGRLLLLPLLGEDGNVTRAVGVFGLDNLPQAGARRFGVPDGGTRRIEPLRPPEPERARVARGAVPRPSAAKILGAGLAEPGRPFLRLVVSND